MRRLVLLRHAHADPGRCVDDDFHRPLSDRGHDRLATVAPAIASRVSLDRIVSSAALRTVETARALARAARLDESALETDTSLYEVPSGVLYERLLRVDGALESVAFVLHNPGVSDLARDLVNGLIRGFEPADFAVIRFDCAWGEITHGAGTLET